MTAPAQTSSFPARADALGAVCAFVEAWAAAAGLAGEDALRLRLVVEELFLNVALHGYAGRPGSVALSLAAEGTDTVLVLEDSAPPFDPFAAAGEVSASADPFARPVGRLGIALVLKFARDHHYQRVDGRNRVELRVPRAGVPVPPAGEI